MCWLISSVENYIVFVVEISFKLIMRRLVHEDIQTQAEKEGKMGMGIVATGNRTAPSGKLKQWQLLVMARNKKGQRGRKVDLLQSM